LLVPLRERDLTGDDLYVVSTTPPSIVLEALSRTFKEGLRWELLYADDLALAAESEDQLMDKIKRWKDGMEYKGLRVNGKSARGRPQGRLGPGRAGAGWYRRAPGYGTPGHRNPMGHLGTLTLKNSL
jgi:hypothetical protein